MAGRKVEDLTMDDLLAAWVEIDKPIPRQKNEFTAREYAEKIGKKYDWANDRLKHLEGEYVTARLAVVDGHKMKLYRFTKAPPK